MEKNCIENISDFLGSEDERYFSSGFKYVDVAYENLIYREKSLSGEVIVNSEWNKKTDKSTHLGTVEYIAIASSLCEQILKTKFYLSSQEIMSSWICYLKTKIQSCIDLTENTVIHVSGKLILTEKIQDTVNQYASSFEIRINNTLIKIRINHPVSFWFKVTGGNPVEINKSGIYSIGYKDREHSIEHIFIDKETMKCTASVSVRDKYHCKSGIGSKYQGMLITDIIIISGQLVQTLFYTIEQTSRRDAGNIWLKEFEVTIDNPESEMFYDAKLSFEDVKLLKKNDEIWKSVLFTSKLGKIYSSIKMVSKINQK
ncbi:MAG: hypothetical protein LBP83_06770 [Dysgonamonadaceae bacterium]|jgi:hypothetical protein|nr:hypothetical protein [Dysgonamonadaceae bacterium]